MARMARIGKTADDGLLPATNPQEPETAAPAGTNVATIDALPTDMLEDWRWLFEQYQAGHLRPFRGQHVAVIDRKIVGSDLNPIALETNVASRLHVNPDRLVVFYVD